MIRRRLDLLHQRRGEPKEDEVVVFGLVVHFWNAARLGIPTRQAAAYFLVYFLPDLLTHISHGKGNDCALVLDDAAKNYPPPGQAPRN